MNCNVLYHVSIVIILIFISSTEEFLATVLMAISLFIFMILIGRLSSYLFHEPKIAFRSRKLGSILSNRPPPISDTIYGLSSGSSGVTGVAVIRVSGPLSTYCLEALTVKSIPSMKLVPRMAHFTPLYCPKTKDMIDKCLVLWFKSPRSFTGEDVVEFHVHGSRAVIKAIFEAFQNLNNRENNQIIRPAERGEFTRRAFENGKMDLTEVEGLADLLQAETSEQRKQALLQMDGALRERYEKWREILLKCLAHTEAVIDFGDDDRENDINDDAMAALTPTISKLKTELERFLHQAKKGEIIREGVQIALVGQPNAGKSSLINALAGRPAAIVSPIAGTTR
jgi:tRNA modification GTPase